MHLNIALLRGINVGRSARIPMAELRALCESLGWQDVRTYIQSGNIVFRTASDPRRAEAQLEEALQRRFGVTPAVLVRTATDFVDVVQRNPFEAESRSAPNLVMLALSKEAPAATALDALRERAEAERLERVGDALWIYYAGGAGRSKLSPGLLDRLAGSPVTTRNWRTVVKLVEMVTDGS